jgi:hypothetical protein
MPTEFRRIVFTNAELRQALDASRDPVRVPVPEGQLQSVKFVDETRENLIVSIHVMDCEADRVERRSLPASFVAAALIKHCMAIRVPLPRGAQKSLVISGDNIALELRSG